MVWWAASVVGWSTPALAVTGAGPEVSHGRGKKGGVVVLYPRLVPETDDPTVRAVAAGVQEALAAQAATLVPPEKVDARPSPERVCPRDGCRAVSVSLLLGQMSGGCAAVALVGPPGPEPQRIVPLAGTVDVSGAGLPFRDLPENHVVVREFVPCDQLRGALDLPALQRALVEVGLGAPAAP
jgi:hypothetical protein